MGHEQDARQQVDSEDVCLRVEVQHEDHRLYASPYWPHRTDVLAIRKQEYVHIMRRIHDTE